MKKVFVEKFKADERMEALLNSIKYRVQAASLGHSFFDLWWKNLTVKLLQEGEYSMESDRKGKRDSAGDAGGLGGL